LVGGGKMGLLIIINIKNMEGISSEEKIFHSDKISVSKKEDGQYYIDFGDLNVYGYPMPTWLSATVVDKYPNSIRSTDPSSVYAFVVEPRDMSEERVKNMEQYYEAITEYEKLSKEEQERTWPEVQKSLKKFLD